MKILDWYIIRKFLGTYFFITLVIMAIAVIFDVSEKFEDFYENNAPIGEILLDYYLNFVIYYSNLFSSLIIFISVIMFTSKMAQNTEIVAILSSGVSFRRLLVPYWISATFLCIFSLWLNHFVLPDANVARLEFEELYIKNPYRVHQKNMHREYEPGQIASFQNYLTTKNMARNFSLETWDGNQLLKKTIAEKAYWDTTKNCWRLENYYIRYYKEDLEHVVTHGKELDTVISFTPKDFARRLSAMTAMDFFELNDYIEQLEIIGSDRVVNALMEKHHRTSYPVATYILTLIGVSIASRKVRGGIGLHLAAGIGLVFIYIFFMKISTVGATNAGLDPLIAVWIPNFIFTGIGLFLYGRAQK